MAQGKLRDHVELASLIAIVISIALLGYEIRQNTSAVQATALQQHFAQHSALMLARLDNPELRSAIDLARSGLEALAEDQNSASLYVPYTANVMRDHFIAFELMQSGLLPESQWRTYHAALERSLNRSKGSRELWDQRRQEYPDEFRLMVDSLVSAAESE